MPRFVAEHLAAAFCAVRMPEDLAVGESAEFSKQREEVCSTMVCHSPR